MAVCLIYYFVSICLFIFMFVVINYSQARVYKRLMKLGINPKDVNVMSQYNAQCSEMKKTLGSDYKNVQVNTVFQSQGKFQQHITNNRLKEINF